MRSTDSARTGRTARLARYIQIERRKTPGPLAVLRRQPHGAAGGSRLAQFLRIARGRTA